MIDFSRLPDITFIGNNSIETLKLSISGGKIQWLSDWILKKYPRQKRIGLIYPKGSVLIMVWFSLLKDGKLPCILQHPTSKISKNYWKESIEHSVKNIGLEALIVSREISFYQLEDITSCVVFGDMPSKSTPGNDIIYDGSIIQLSSGATGYKKTDLIKSLINYPKANCQKMKEKVSSGKPVG